MGLSPWASNVLSSSAALLELLKTLKAPVTLRMLVSAMMTPLAKVTTWLMSFLEAQWFRITD